MRIDFFCFSHYVSLWREEKLPWAQYKRCTSRILGSPMRMSHNTYSSWNNLKLLLRLSWTESKCVIPICKSVISSFKTNLWFLSFKCSCTINMRYRYMESMVIEELYKKTTLGKSQVHPIHYALYSIYNKYVHSLYRADKMPHEQMLCTCFKLKQM